MPALPLKAVTYWVRPARGASLPDSSAPLEHLLRAFYAAFPEYDQALKFSQFARVPHYVFVYAAGECTGLLPEAGAYLRDLLEAAFPGAEVRVYGKPWAEV
ncbi:MAG: hypothetical protein SFU83_09220 [Meiothermus sp.]|nr:hypothetical protein [Meiothermus sp.]